MAQPSWAGCAERASRRTGLRRDEDPPDHCLILVNFGWAKTMHRGVGVLYSGSFVTMAAVDFARVPRLVLA